MWLVVTSLQNTVKCFININLFAIFKSFVFWGDQSVTLCHSLSDVDESLDLSLAGQTEEPPSCLSSPILDTPLDSPLSCADLTLDSTAELTVEDVRDFLT